MRTAYRAFGIALALLIAACTSARTTDQPGAVTATVAPPTRTPTPTQALPEATASATLPPAAPRWASLTGSDALIDDPSWACLGPLVDGAIQLEAISGYRTVVNTAGSVLRFEGDFGVAATIEVARGDWGAFVLYGALPQGAWWERMRRLDLEWHQDQLTVAYWDGAQDSPSLVRTFGAPNRDSRAQIGLRRQGEQLAFLIDGTQVGQIDDPGAFPTGQAYLGANVPPNGLLILHQIHVETPYGGEGMVQIAPPADAAVYTPSAPALRELAERRGIAVGAAVAAGPLRCDLAYGAALAHEFNALTTENALKFGPVHPERERYAFGDADAIVAFAEAHDMQVRGHTLVWHQQLPAWVEDQAWTRQELRAVLQEHISAVVGRYRGRVYAWDVVNEAVSDAGGMRDTVWLRTIGYEYLDDAFRWAHEADPEALLFYNDYSAEGLGFKSDAVYDLVRRMLERGVPVHGVGLQMHLAVGASPDPQELLANLTRLGDLGLQVHITELDVRIPGDPNEMWLAAQAEIYRTVTETCLSAGNCTALVTWGVTDRYSWIPTSHPGYGAALLLDERYAPKPAYDAVRDALAAP